MGFEKKSLIDELIRLTQIPTFWTSDVPFCLTGLFISFFIFWLIGRKILKEENSALKLFAYVFIFFVIGLFGPAILYSILPILNEGYSPIVGIYMNSIIGSLVGGIIYIIVKKRNIKNK